MLNERERNILRWRFGLKRRGASTPWRRSAASWASPGSACASSRPERMGKLRNSDAQPASGWSRTSLFGIESWVA